MLLYNRRLRVLGKLKLVLVRKWLRRSRGGSWLLRAGGELCGNRANRTGGSGCSGDGWKRLSFAAKEEIETLVEQPFDSLSDP